MIDPVRRFEVIYKFTQMYRDEQEALKVLHGFTDRVIKSRREQLLNGSRSKSVDDDDIGSKKKMALLDLLLEATVDGKPLTDSDIREEVDTFVS